MGEAKKKAELRTLQHVEQEYFQVCARAGDLAYQIHSKRQEQELNQLYEKLKHLNKEAKDLHDREEQKKKLLEKEVVPNTEDPSNELTPEIIAAQNQAANDSPAV